MKPRINCQAGARGSLGLALGLVSVFLLLSAEALLASQAKPPATQGPSAGSPDGPALAADTTLIDQRVVVYYFHTNYRCNTCRKLEAYSHAAIEATFPKELESGRLVWRLVNVEDKGNEHFVEDYGLYTKSLVLVQESKGQQVRWKNLEKIWELVTQQEKFYEYVQDEVRTYLAATP